MMSSNNNAERTPLLSSSSSGRTNSVGMRGRHTNNNNNISLSSNVSGTTSNSSLYSRSVREFDTLPAAAANFHDGSGGAATSPSVSYLRNLPNDGDIILDDDNDNDYYYCSAAGGDNDKEDRRGGFLHKTWRRIRMHSERLQQRIMVTGFATTTSSTNIHDHTAGDLSLHVNNINNNNDSRNITSTENTTHDNIEDDDDTTNIFCGVVANDDDYYYEDAAAYLHDDESSRRCSFGTREQDGIWLNLQDNGATIMACTVWLLISYSAFTIILLTFGNHLRVGVAAVYCTICCFALACHAKCMFTNPGAVPSCALPIIIHNNNSNINSNNKVVKYHTMCSVCQSYKPQYTHHCRICNRCIVRMDHHCPWMNNCIGVNNLKHFVLFLVYTWIGSVLALIIFAVNYFFCLSPECEFNDNAIEINLVRVMTFICIVTLMFTSSMLMNVIYGITTGIGTIDRLKKKADDQWHSATEEPIPLRDIVGISTLRITLAGGGGGGQQEVVVARLADWWWWFLPVDPQFDDYDRVMGYATAVRLLRERQHQQHNSADKNNE